MTNIDITADSPDNVVQVPDSPILKQVAALVEEFGQKEGSIKRLEQQIAEMKVRQNQIRQESLPAAMTEAGLTSFVTASGRSVKIEQVINGNIPAQSSIDKAKGPEKVLLVARREEALAVIHSKWPGLVKTEVSLLLGRGEAGVATRIVELLRKELQLTPTVSETIHPATLNAHFGELLADGKLEEIPVEPFALYVGPLAKIK